MPFISTFAGGSTRGFKRSAVLAAVLQGGLWSWGRNNYGDLGLGNTTSYSSPKQVGALTTWVAISEGVTHSLAVKTDGTLWSWGAGYQGGLGHGNTTNYSSPKQVGALTTWSKVTAGSHCSFAIKTDGTLWSWGIGVCLGLGIAGSYSSPKQVGALTTWATVSSNPNATTGTIPKFTLAIKTDGTLWSWGSNTFGQLGLGNITNYYSPKQVGALATWATVFAGGAVKAFTLAVKTDGTLWSWGGNSAGELGLGNITNYSSPKQVGALTAWSNVTSGQYFALASKTDGTLWSWGSNSHGQLGLGNTTNYSSPKQVGALTAWSKISTGISFSFAIKTDGALWSWGRNNISPGQGGQLGLGNITNYSSPMQVGALTTWFAIAGGGRNAIALIT